MLLAEFFMWFGGVVIIGVLGFFGVGLAVLFRGVAAMFRGIARVARRIPPGQEGSAPDALVCPNPYCGYLNAGTARYCARCGQSMRAATHVKNYG